MEILAAVVFALAGALGAGIYKAATWGVKRSVQDVVRAEIAPLAVGLKDHLEEEQVLIGGVRDDFRSFVAEQRRENSEMWKRLADHGLDRRSP